MKIDAATTALVLIDLQEGIVANSVAPHSSGEVIERSVRLAGKIRSQNGLVVLVTVDWAPGYGDAPRQPTDLEAARPADGPPAGFARIVPALNGNAADLRIVKRQWGAFFGTELDLQLRRRGITTIILGGIATNLGVESTARAAWEHGYALIFAEDAMSSFSDDMHQFAVTKIFPRLGRVRRTSDVIDAVQ